MRVFEAGLPMLRSVCLDEVLKSCHENQDQNQANNNQEKEAQNDDQVVFFAPQDNQLPPEERKQIQEWLKNFPLVHLQVVVKVQEFNMLPNSNYEGFWHMEGERQDNIAAVLLYYYCYDEGLKGGSLHLRPHTLSYSLANPTYAFDVDDGVIPIKQGTAIAFSNKEFVHRVGLVENLGEKIAARGYVAFFLIDPAAPLQNSTATIGCCQLEYRARQLDACFGELSGILPLKALCLICKFAQIGRTQEEIDEALQWFDFRSKKTIDQARKRSIGRYTFKDGWSPIDCGIASFSRS